MRIAIDYDGTYTADPELWDQFIELAKARGHGVVIVTCRRPTDENYQDCHHKNCLTVFTNLSSKVSYMEKLGINVDVWIDDDPACILHGK